MWTNTLPPIWRDWLDKIEEGVVPLEIGVSNFYPDLEEAVKVAQKDLEKVKIEDEVTDVICEQCGRNMVVKYALTVNFWPAPDFRSAGIPSLSGKDRCALPQVRQGHRGAQDQKGKAFLRVRESSGM